ncbi:hypothetical protein J6590_069563 [Homalodisca vitripennis]|nr:hypothetical protein J6590_069563 [Homalodisca vitripennis]
MEQDFRWSLEFANHYKLPQRYCGKFPSVHEYSRNRSSDLTWSNEIEFYSDMLSGVHHGSQFSSRAGKPWKLMSATTHDDIAASSGKSSSPGPRQCET